MNAQAAPHGSSATVTAEYIRDSGQMRVTFSSYDSDISGFSLDELDALEHAIRIARIKLKAAGTGPALRLVEPDETPDANQAFHLQQHRLQAVPT